MRGIPKSTHLMQEIPNSNTPIKSSFWSLKNDDVSAAPALKTRTMTHDYRMPAIAPLFGGWRC